MKNVNTFQSLNYFSHTVTFTLRLLSNKVKEKVVYLSQYAQIIQL